MKTLGKLIKLFILISFVKPIRVVIKHVTVALDMPTKVPEFIVYAQSIHNSMSASTVYAASAAHLATLATDLATLIANQTACKTTPPTKTTADRNTAWTAVKADLRVLKADVQILVDNSPASALEIIHDAGMKEKGENNGGKRKSSAKNGTVEGTVDLVGEGPGPHDFQMSTDNKTWIPCESSRTQKLTVTGLTSGVVYYFQNRQMLTHGLRTAWTASVSVRVN
jgi:hypothetical protein